MLPGNSRMLRSALEHTLFVMQTNEEEKMEKETCIYTPLPPRRNFRLGDIFTFCQLSGSGNEVDTGAVAISGNNNF